MWNAKCLAIVFFSSSPSSRFSANCIWKCKSVCLILKISQYGGSRRWVPLFPRYLCKNWYKNWYFYFHKTNDHHIWRAGTSTGFDSYLHYQSVYGHQTWQDGTLLDGLLSLKPHDTLITWSCKITWPTKIIISPLP